MKILNIGDFLIEAGIPVPYKRNMSCYDGSSFQCACGLTHNFQSYMKIENYGTTGTNAKMVVSCPDNPDTLTLIQTKYKMLVIFECFESLAGHTR
jgi:hypothetical protein